MYDRETLLQLEEQLIVAQGAARSLRKAGAENPRAGDSDLWGTIEVNLIALRNLCDGALPTSKRWPSLSK